jgi:hypothetical protein
MVFENKTSYPSLYQRACPELSVVAHFCNHIYSGDRRIMSSRPVQEKVSKTPSEKTENKRAESVS